MLRATTPISTIINLNQAIENPVTGDCLLINLDQTLLFPILDKYQHEVDPGLIEPELASTLKMLRDRHIKVIALTARQYDQHEKIQKQLEKLKIVLDDILYVPNNDSIEPQNGLALIQFFESYRQQNKEKNKQDHIKRLFVFDDNIERLKSIADVSHRLDVPIFLKHYVPPQYIMSLPEGEAMDSIFPDNLHSFKQYTSLGGGSKSVFLIHSELNDSPYSKNKIENISPPQKMVLKLGASEIAGKIEMLTLAIYSVLGILVPPMRIYRSISPMLASLLPDKFNLSSSYGLFKISPYIVENKDLSDSERIELIKIEAKNNFIAHVLLGNIDVAKEDNFIIDENKLVYLIDAGANYIYQSLGNNRQQNAWLASEFDTLRDPKINQKGAKWFGDLTEEELKKQLEIIQKKIPQIEKIAWDVSKKLDLPDQLRNEYLDYLSDRMDILATRLQLISQEHAKIDKHASEQTAAGVLTYMIKENKYYVLLSKRSHHDYWDNFGGKSESNDLTLVDTAIREVLEESSQQIKYMTRELLNSPFHDLVTNKENNPYTYRMYICEYHQIDLKKINEKEHTAHQWIPLDKILDAVKYHSTISIENKLTVSIKIDDDTILLYPPLYCMLKQPPVLSNLSLLCHHQKMKLSATLSSDKMEKLSDANLALNPFNFYPRPLNSPNLARSQTVQTILRKNNMLNEIRDKTKNKPLIENQVSLAESLSQSEVHLKAVLGNQYQENDLEANIRLFFKMHPITQSNIELENLIAISINFIEKEKKTINQMFYYHAVDNRVGFVYDVYQTLYRIFQADDKYQVFRCDTQHIRKFNNIIEFLTHYSQDKNEIDNNDAHYNDCAISTNIFLFGNHQKKSSYSISYFLKNKIAREINLEILLGDMLTPFHVTAEEIKRLLSLYKQYIKHEQGRLYQIGLSLEDAREMSYAAGSRGIKNPFQETIDLTEIIKTFTKNPQLIDSNQEYLTNLQARVLVAPHLKLHTEIAIWHQIQNEEKKQYELSLIKIMEAIAYKILYYHTRNADHAKSSLVRILPYILGNELNYSQLSLEDRLKNAALTHDISQVRELIQTYPDLLTNMIQSSQQTIFLIQQNPWTQYSDIPLKIIKCLPEENRLAYVMQYKFKIVSYHFAFIAKIIDLLPASEKMNYFYQHNTQFIMLDDMKILLSVIPLKERINFLTYCQKSLETASVLEEVILFLNHENETVIKNFIFQCIQNTSTLAFALKYIPENERLVFINQLISEKTLLEKKFIPDLGYEGDSLAFHDLVKLLPAKQRFGFLCRYQSLFANASSVRQLSTLLNDEEKEKFALMCVKNVKTLTYALEYIMKNERLIFIYQHIELFNQESISLENEAVSLEIEPVSLENKPFFLENMESIIKLLPSDHQLEFIFKVNLHTLFTIPEKIAVLAAAIDDENHRKHFLSYSNNDPSNSMSRKKMK